MNFLKEIAKKILTPIALTLFSLVPHQNASKVVGSAIPTVPSVFETYLSNQMGTTDTTMTVASTALRDGTSLIGYQCFTIDSNSPTLEYICGTASSGSNTITNLLRGIDPVTGTTTVTALKFSHRLGSDVKITDYPALTILSRIVNGQDFFPNLVQYSNTVLIGNGAPTSTIATKYYVDNSVVSGAPNADNSTKGIVQMATASQASSGTSLGSTGARLSLGSDIATSTCQFASNSVIVSQISNGKINSGCIDQTANYILSGTVLHQASTTISATTTIVANSVTNRALVLNSIPYAFPASQGAYPSILRNDGTGNLTWVPAGPYTYSTTTNSTVANGVATTTTITIPSGVLTASSTISVRGSGICVSTGSASCDFYVRNGVGTTIITGTVSSPANSVTERFNFDAVILGNGSLSAQQSTMDWVSMTTGTVSATSPGQVSSSEGTSAINFANALTLTFLISANNAATMTLNNATLVVNP